MGKLSSSAPRPDQNTGMGGDILTDIGTGALNLPSVATGLLDIAAAPFGGDRPFSKGADRLGDMTGLDFDGMAADRSKYLTPELQEANANVAAAEGFGGTAKAFLQNPRAIVSTIAQAIPSTLAGGIAGAGVKAGAGALAVGRANAAIAGGRGAGASAPVLKALQKGAVAGGVGEGTVSAGYSMSGIDESVDPKKAALASLGAGVGVGLLGGLGGAASRKIGLTDPDLIFVGGRAKLAPGAKRMGIVKRITGGAVSEGMFEEMPQSMVETITQNWAEGKPEFEGIGKAAVEGMIAGMGMGGAANILGAKGPKKDKPKKGGETTRVEGKDFVGPPDPIKDKPAKELIADWIQIGYMLEREKSGINDPETIASLEQARKRGAAEIKERGYTQDIIDQTQTQTDYNKLRAQRDTFVAQQDKLDLVSEAKGKQNKVKVETANKKLADLEAVYPKLSDEFTQAAFNDKFETLSREQDTETRQMNGKKGKAAKKTREKIAALKKEMSSMLAENSSLKYTGDVDLTPKAGRTQAAPAAAPAAATPAVAAAPEQVVEDTTVDLSDENISDEDFLAALDGFGGDEVSGNVQAVTQTPTDGNVVEEPTPAVTEPVTEQPIVETPTEPEAVAAATVAEETVPATQTPEQALEAQVAQQMPAVLRPQKGKGKQAAPPTPTIETFFEDNPETPRNKTSERRLAKLEAKLDDMPLDTLLNAVASLDESTQGRELKDSTRAVRVSDAEFARLYLETVRQSELGEFLESTKTKAGKPLTSQEMFNIAQAGLGNLSKRQQAWFLRWIKLALVDNVENPYAALSDELEKAGDRTKAGNPHDRKNIQKTVAKGMQAIVQSVKVMRGLSSDYEARLLVGPYLNKASNVSGKDSIYTMKKALAAATSPEERKLITEQIRLMKLNKQLYTGEHFTNDADSSYQDRAMGLSDNSSLSFGLARSSIAQAGMREEGSVGGAGQNVIGAKDLDAAATAKAYGFKPGTVSLRDARLLNDFYINLEKLDGNPNVAPEKRHPDSQGEIQKVEAQLATIVAGVETKAEMLDEARQSEVYPEADKIWAAVGKEVGDSTPFAEIDEVPSALNIWLGSVEVIKERSATAEQEMEDNPDFAGRDQKVKDRVMRQLNTRLNEGLVQAYKSAASATKGAPLEVRRANLEKQLVELTGARDQIIRRRDKLVSEMRARSDANETMTERLGTGGVLDTSIGGQMTPAQITNAQNMGKSVGITEDKPTYAEVQPLIVKDTAAKAPLSLTQAKKQPLMAPKLEAMRNEHKQGTYWPEQTDSERSEHTTVGKDDLIYTYRKDEDGTGWELWQTRNPVGYIEETRDVLLHSSSTVSGKFTVTTIKDIVNGKLPARTFNVDVATRKPKSQAPVKSAETVAADLKRKKDNRPQSMEEGIKKVTKDMDTVTQAEAADVAAQETADAGKVKVTRKSAKPPSKEPRPPQIREQQRMLEDYSFNWGMVMAGTLHAYGSDASKQDMYADPMYSALENDEAVTLTKMSPEEFYEQAAYILADKRGIPVEEALEKVQRVSAKAVQSATSALETGMGMSAPVLDITNQEVQGVDRAIALFAATKNEPVYVAVVDTVEGTSQRRDIYTKSKRAFTFPGKNTPAPAPPTVAETGIFGVERIDSTASTEAMWAAKAAAAEAKVRESVPQRPVTNPSTIAQVQEELKPYMPPGNKAMIRIVQSFAELEMYIAQHDIDVSPAAGGFVHNGKVFLIASNINVGEAPGILLHEVGVHLGMTAAQVHSYAYSIRQMALAGNETAQFAIGSAYNAADTQAGAGASINQLDIDHEIVAYFVQDAVNSGIDPTNMGEQDSAVQGFFRNLLGFLRAALQAFGFRANALTAQNIVDAAYGAANTAMRTPRNNTPQVRMMVAQTQAAVSRSYDRWVNEGQGRRNWETLKKMTRKVTGMFMFSQDFADWVAEQMPVARRYFDIVARRQAIRGDMDAQLQRIVDPLDKMSPADRQEINKYMVLSQEVQAWGYKPHEGAQEADNIDPTLEKMYNAMTEEQQGAIFKVFQYADKLQHEQQQALRDEILKSNEYLLQNDALTLEEIVALESDLVNDLNEFDSKFQERRTAWLPLRRHGNYAVVYMSDALKQAQQENAEDVRAMRADTEHYWVEFTNSNNKAQELADDLRGSKNNPGNVTHFEREQMMTKTELIPYNFMNSLRANIERNTTRDAAGRVIDQPTSSQMDAWTKMYIAQLSETSIRKSELNREEIGGFDQDMIRGFVQYGSAVSGTISGIRLNQETHEVLNEIRAAARDATDDPSRDRLSEIKNEILTRHGQNINSNPNPLTEATLATTSFWMLLSSPAYYLQNSTQPWMLTLPVLAGRFGLGSSSNAMYKAYGQMQRAWSASHEGTLSSKLSGELADLESIKEEIGQEKFDLLMDLKNGGLFDVGVAADFGSFANDSGQAVALINGVHRKMIHGVRSVEVFNRGVTALAAYELASRGGVDLPMRVNDQGTKQRMTPHEYAMETVLTTQGDYSGHNAPSIIRRLGGIGKVMTQFRKFQLIQIGLLTRLVKSSFKEADPTERAMARIQLGYIIGAHGAAGGLLGLPAANLAGMAITAAFGDEDDPDDFETMMRRSIGDSAMADLILKGLPAFANVDISSKVGMGNTFAILPYTDMELSRDGAAITMAALFGGPTGGQVMRWADAVGMAADGNWAMAFTEAQPRGLRDVGRAILYGTRGVQRKNAYQDIAIAAEDLSWFDISSQAVGLPSTTLTKRQDANAGLTRSKEHFKERSTQIKAIYIEGRETKNPAKMREAREAWRDLQTARRKVGFAKQDFNLLTTSYREKLKRQRNMRHGVLTESTNADYIDVFFDQPLEPGSNSAKPVIRDFKEYER